MRVYCLVSLYTGRVRVWRVVLPPFLSPLKQRHQMRIMACKSLTGRRQAYQAGVYAGRQRASRRVQCLRKAERG